MSVKAANRKARNKFTGDDKTNLNESGGDNVWRKVLTVSNGGLL